MKKIIIFIIVLFPIQLVYSDEGNNPYLLYGSWDEESFNIHIGYGSFGGGINFSSNNESDIGLDINIGSIYMHNRITGLGVQIIPIQYKNSYIIENLYSGNYDYHLVSFLAPNFYWNLLDFPFGKNRLPDSYFHNIFGPFIRINWLNWVNFDTFDFKIYYEVGLKFIIKYQHFDLFCIETGYQNMNDRNNFFIRIKFDNALPLALFHIFGSVITRSSF
jgi:hypothetical protein